MVAKAATTTKAGNNGTKMTTTTTTTTAAKKKNDTATGNNVITEEMSKRVCDHMNEDHMVSVYVMAKHYMIKNDLLDRGYKISNTKLVTVSMNDATIQVTLCRKDLCQQKVIRYPFVPTLQTPNDIRSRMVSIHYQLCSTPIYCYNHTLYVPTLVFMLMTFYYYVTSVLFPSSAFSMVQKSMKDCFLLFVLGHGMMAIGTIYINVSVLKIVRRQMIIHWFIATLCTGWLAFKELLDIVDVNEKCNDAKIKKTEEAAATTTAATSFVKTSTDADDTKIKST